MSDSFGCGEGDEFAGLAQVGRPEGTDFGSARRGTLIGRHSFAQLGTDVWGTTIQTVVGCC